MKKYLVIGLSLLAVVLLSVFLIIPIFAQESADGDAWQQMYQACGSGDWQGMRTAMQSLFGRGDVPPQGFTAPGQGGCDLCGSVGGGLGNAPIAPSSGTPVR